MTTPQPPATGEITDAQRAAVLREADHLLTYATVLEIPCTGTAAPLMLRLSYGHTDRWAVCDYLGRRFTRGAGWCFEDGGIGDDQQRDTARFTLAEAVGVARTLAAGTVRVVPLDRAAERCECAHPDDPTPCQGPLDAVTVLVGDSNTVPGCEWHAARMLASLEAGRVHPGTVLLAAARVYLAAAELPPFAWTVQQGGAR
jgi:hypothetical protein